MQLCGGSTVVFKTDRERVRESDVGIVSVTLCSCLLVQQKYKHSLRFNLCLHVWPSKQQTHLWVDLGLFSSSCVHADWSLSVSDLFFVVFILFILIWPHVFNRFHLTNKLTSQFSHCDQWEQEDEIQMNCYHLYQTQSFVVSHQLIPYLTNVDFYFCSLEVELLTFPALSAALFLD